MNIDADAFRIGEGERVALHKRPTAVDPLYGSKADYKHALREHVKALARLQRVHYAANRHALLVIFQAMDAAGKDSAIRHIMSGVNPQGCQVTSFKHPSATELEHDFLWRSTLVLPQRGQIGIFNRSYYEEVLVVRVHPELLRAEAVPGPKGPVLWRGRYRSITQFEAHLSRNGTKVVKIFLHLSKEEQRRRFLARIDEPDKNWKFGDADMVERGFWDDYMKAYAACLSATSTRDSPWYAVPADDKKNARLICSQIVLDALASLRPAFPETTEARRRELAIMREQLEREGEAAGA
jgi:PPK2 family polyphosphate:nucleotide phosphotransferase